MMLFGLTFQTEKFKGYAFLIIVYTIACIILDWLLAPLANKLNYTELYTLYSVENIIPIATTWLLTRYFPPDQVFKGYLF